MERRPTIPQADLKASYLTHKAEIDAAVCRVLESGWYILGQEVAAFEEEFAAYIGVRYAIGVANGTDALELALRACGIGPGDAVFTVSHTAVATVAAIERCGATPVLVDIDPTTYTMDPNHLEEALKASGHRLSNVGHPKAIVPVHLYGHPADMTAILDIAHRYGLYVIEDCAQSHGATLAGRKTGTWGNLAAFSFYPTKNLGAFGDGGMVVTSDLEPADKVQLLRQYGWKNRYISEIPGENSRLDEIQAAILRVKLKHLDQENELRRGIANQYHQLLASTSIKLPVVHPLATHVYHQFVIRVDKRDALREHLENHKINTAIHYPLPIHLQPAYRGRLGEPGMLPVTEKTATEILSLPIFPELTFQEVQKVAGEVKAWVSRKEG